MNHILRSQFRGGGGGGGGNENPNDIIGSDAIEYKFLRHIVNILTNILVFFLKYPTLETENRVMMRHTYMFILR